MHDQGNSNSIPIKFAQVGEECSSQKGTRTLFVTDKVFFFERLRQKLGFFFRLFFLALQGGIRAYDAVGCRRVWPLTGRQIFTYSVFG